MKHRSMNIYKATYTLRGEDDQRDYLICAKSADSAYKLFWNCPPAKEIHKIELRQEYVLVEGYDKYTKVLDAITNLNIVVDDCQE